MTDKKVIGAVITIAMLMTSALSGCVFFGLEPLSVKYEINIENPQKEQFNLSIPTLILGNRFHNTPKDLEPIVNLEDYSVTEGRATLGKYETDNCTLLNIQSSAKNITLELRKQNFDHDKYSDYKNNRMLCPFPNSYYLNDTTTASSLQEDQIGIFYDGNSQINVSISFSMDEHEGIQYEMNGNFLVEKENFQTKPVMIIFEEPAP